MNLNPVVRAGKPASEKDYEKTQVEGIDIYLSNELKKKVLKINRWGWGRIGQFVVRDKAVL